MRSIQFNAIIERFGTMGEKTGWTYIKIPDGIAQQLYPGNKKSFRVKGKLDDWSFKQLALIPMGGGDFILALNAEIRKHIKKHVSETIAVDLSVDNTEIEISPDLLACMEEDQAAKTFFFKLPASHQKYFSRWIESAKTIETKSKRIVLAIKALSRQMHYGEMIRADKAKKDTF